MANSNYYIKNFHTNLYITDANAAIGTQAVTAPGANGGPPAAGARFNVQLPGPDAAGGARTIASIAQDLFLGPGPVVDGNPRIIFQNGAFTWTFVPAGPGRWNIRVPAQDRFWFDNNLIGNFAILGPHANQNQCNWLLEAA